MPSPSVPLGYALCSAIFQVDGATRTPTITMGCFPSGIINAATINTRWRDAITGTGDPFASTTMPTTLSLVETRVLYNNAGFLFSDVDVTVVTGGTTAQVAPMNTAVLVNKVTGLAGRKYRGRMFTPPTFAESSLNAAGVISGGTVTTLQASWTNVLTYMTAQDIPPVLFHTDGSTPTPVTALTVSERIGTIGRRLRR